MTDRVSSSGRKVCWAVIIGLLAFIGPVASVQAQEVPNVWLGNNPSGTDRWNAPGNWSNDGLANDAEPDGANPTFIRDHGLVDGNLAPNSQVDDETLGAGHWEIRSLTFLPGPHAINWRIFGLPIYVGAGGINHLDSMLHTIESDIWLYEDMTIHGGSGLFLTGEEINNSRDTSRDLTFSGYVHVNNPVIRGDGNVIFNGDTILRGEHEYTGDTILAGRVVITTDAAFGLSPRVIVNNGTENRISADDEPLFLPQDFELFGDLRLGGPALIANSAGAPITITGVVELMNGGRRVITEQATEHYIEGRVETNGYDVEFYNFGNSRMNVLGRIDGSGRVVNDGPGTLSLQGDNIFTGDIVLRDGIFEIGSDAALGNATDILVEGRTFIRTLSPITVGADVTMDDDLEILEGAGLTFDAPITVNTASAFRLRSSVPTVVSANSGITLNQNLTIRGPEAMVIEGVISGAGEFRQRDASEVWLGATNTHTGLTDIRQYSTLRLLEGASLAGNVLLEDSDLHMEADTFIAGDVEVGRFSTLSSGTEIAGDLGVERRGVIRPGGDEIGTLEIGGDALFRATSAGGATAMIKFNVQEESDTLLVGGNVEIQDGARFYMDQIDEGFVLGGERFTLLEAGGLDIQGDQDEVVVSAESLFLRFEADTAEIANNNLVVEAVRDPFESQAQGRNNITLSRALDNLVEPGLDSDTTRMLTAFDRSADAAAFNQNLRQLSPTTYTAGVDATVQAGRGYHQQVHSQARTTREGRLDYGSAATRFAERLGPTPWAMAAAQPYLWDDTYRDRLEDRPEDRRQYRGEPTRTRRSIETLENRWNVFANAYGVHDRIDSTSERPGLRANTGGFAIGADYSFSETFYLGVSAGYSYTDVDFREGRGDGTVHSFRAGPYAGLRFGELTIDASATYGYHQNDYDQNVNISGLVQEKNADFDAHDLSLYVNVGYEFMMPNQRTSFTPVGSLNYTHYRRDGFTETGGGATNFDVSSQDVDMLEGTIGVRFEHRYRTDGTTIIPNAFLGYSYEFLGDDNDVQARFVGTTQSFTLDGPSPDRHALRVGAGVRALLSESVQGFIQYNGRFQSNQQGHAGIVGMSFQF
ncbi:autotransporter outer membrane beta-barrel domain-containing protein [Phycisphaerales bacterium AB-hyl4]|uniref:Autotransporter outer membrane beta-barrel domain-containing protein n=1 Tax=Natronomicrosphaera hydrolytica TaxID=3242702 RepID=A0ABV4U455_9BACT